MDHGQVETPLSRIWGEREREKAKSKGETAVFIATLPLTCIV